MLRYFMNLSNSVHPITPVYTTEMTSIDRERVLFPYYTQFNGHRHIRFFYTKRPKKITSHLLMSTFLLTGAKEAFQKLNLPDDHFVMCVKYKQTPDGKGDDVQLFITGTVEAYEIGNTQKTAIEELKEETRFKVSEVRFVDKYEDNRSVFDTYATDINKLKAIRMPEMRKSEKVTDNKKYKVTCIVSGNKHEMKRAVASIKRSTQDKSNDDIDSLVFIPVRDVKKIISMIEENKKNKRYDPFIYKLSEDSNNV